MSTALIAGKADIHLENIQTARIKTLDAVP